MNIPKLEMPTPITTGGFKFLQKVRVKESASKLIHLENSEWVKFYAGATGQLVRFNPEDGMMVVLLDTGSLLPENNKVMEPFYPADLEPLEDTQSAMLDGLAQSTSYLDQLKAVE